ncbi:aldose epimerase family protein [Poseidonocella sedimentorum]|uniref:Aldose 1-epimerase n=1 Tax=Poseidonocella sedimentorum TaxID=871652 RepID=A0A1I6D637_9RHOB|nr:aldose epimerase family protein [Poseidonocella sedimentorum]SFR00944.1 aldose 1-epimerase [Poseidonocella sedimentorum]
MTPVGPSPRGEDVHEITLSRGALTARIWTLGAALARLHLAPFDHNLTLAPQAPSGMTGPLQYAGAVVGPVANRLRNARLPMPDGVYTLPANEPSGHVVHCGAIGLHHDIWEVVDHGPEHARLAITRAHLSDGLPGHRRFEALYQLADDALHLTLSAETDAPTAANLAHHPYWALADAPTISDHTLWIAADHVLETDEGLIPLDAPRAVDGTAFDYRSARRLTDSARLDHNFCLSDARTVLRDVARLIGPNGLSLTIATTEPGLQVFNGFSLPRSDAALADGRAMRPHAGIALEPQFWPDAPNQPAFPSILLHPGESYRQETVYGITTAA